MLTLQLLNNIKDGNSSDKVSQNTVIYHNNANPQSQSDDFLQDDNSRISYDVDTESQMMA